MPTREHEMWLELIRQQPGLVAELLDFVHPGIVPARSPAQLESGDLSEHAPAAYHADAVVTLGAPKPTLAVIIEVQLRRDARKHLSWPAYIATARARLCCPTALLVICPSASVAGWAGQPIELGHPGLVLRPLVLGPNEVPVFTDDQAGEAAPELAVVSAAIHGAGPDGRKIFATMLERLADIEPERAQGYIDEVLAVLPKAARHLLEDMMTARTREYKSDFARRYYGQGVAEGKAEGKAELILTVLSARGVSVPDDARARIIECTDLEQLEEWARRAATANAVADLFD